MQSSDAPAYRRAAGTTITWHNLGPSHLEASKFRACEDLSVNNRGLLGDRKNIEPLRFQKNPHASFSDLPRRVGTSNPAVKERVLRLEESGIVTGWARN